MPQIKVTFDTVKKIGLALPGVEEGTMYGSPALELRGNLLACIPMDRSTEPDSVAVRINKDDRADLIAEAPDVYYMTDHFAGYDAVLVRLARVTPDVLRDSLGMAYKFVSRKHPVRPASGKRTRPHRKK